MRLVRFLLVIFVCAIFINAKNNASNSVREPQPYVLRYNGELLGYPTIPANNPLTVQGVALGRLLFYDPILSSNNEMSCGTCHIQSKSFTDGRPLAVGTYQDTLPRNTMSLVNLAWAEQFFWDGRKSSLEALIREPVTNLLEMAQDTIELILELNEHAHYPDLFESAFPNQPLSMELISRAIAQFLRTIVSNGLTVDYNAISVNYDNAENKKTENDIAREESLSGSFIRFSEMCSPCHAGSVYGNLFMANNGLADSSILSVKAPSLLNVMHTAPYMHDGRFETLAEVMEHYSIHLNSLSDINPDIDLNRNNTLIKYDVEHIYELFSLFEDSTIMLDSNFSDPFVEGFEWSKY